MIFSYSYLHVPTQVLDAYFKRGGDGAKTNFVQVKGFYLLGSQLKRYKVSPELMSALYSIVIGQDINLKGDQLVILGLA